MCGYVLWQRGQLCLAGKMRVKVQAVLESRYMQWRLKHRAVFMREQIYVAQPAR